MTKFIQDWIYRVFNKGIEQRGGACRCDLLLRDIEDEPPIAGNIGNAFDFQPFGHQISREYQSRWSGPGKGFAVRVYREHERIDDIIIAALEMIRLRKIPVIFYVVLVPVGLVRRVVGRDPLERKFVSNQASYWYRRKPVADITRYYKQY